MKLSREFAMPKSWLGASNDGLSLNLIKPYGNGSECMPFC
jgi:hypothetical protein